MNSRYLVASALAAAIVAPVALSAQKSIKEELERQKRKFAEEIASGEVPL